jgi:hypothetical protein
MWGIARKFLAVFTLKTGLTSGCAHIGLRHASLQAITVKARITHATPNELLFAVEWFFANRPHILTRHA